MDTQPISTQPSITPPDPFSTPVLPPTPQPSHLVPIILSVLITTILLVGGYYLFTKYSSKKLIPNPSPTPSNVSEDAWKKYRNNGFEFELQLPPGVKMVKELNDGYSNRSVTFEGSDLNFDVMLRSGYGIDFEKYYFMDAPIARKDALSGLAANVYEMPNGYCDGPGCSKAFISIVAPNGPDLVHLSFYGDTDLSDTEKKIIESFKFSVKTTEVPIEIKKIFSAINQDFGVNILPTHELEFYSLQGFIKKESWKLDLSTLLNDKSKFTQLYQILEKSLKQDINSSADGVGQSVQGYENDQVYCFFLRGFNQSDYISCILK